MCVAPVAWITPTLGCLAAGMLGTVAKRRGIPGDDERLGEPRWEPMTLKQLRAMRRLRYVFYGAGFVFGVIGLVAFAMC